MFKLFKQKPPPQRDKLFRMTLHIARGTNTEIPSKLMGAYVPVFVGAPDHEAAALKSVSAVRSRGFEFIDIEDRLIYELDPLSWDAFIMEAWPDFIAEFPVQAKVAEALKVDFICFGPFASYEKSAT